MPIPPHGRASAGRENRTHLVRLVTPVLSQRASPALFRAEWGSRESNTERAPYQRVQVTVPSYPECSFVIGALGIEPSQSVYKTPGPDQDHAPVPVEGFEPTLNRF